MPCLNEAETLATCIEKAQRSLQELGIAGEVIVADNGSTDGSQEIAAHFGRAGRADCGQRLRPTRSWAALPRRAGSSSLWATPDDSYDFAGLGPFVEKLREGYDLVMGNRFRGGIKPKAMPAAPPVLRQSRFDRHRADALPQPVR